MNSKSKYLQTYFKYFQKYSNNTTPDEVLDKACTNINCHYCLKK